MEKFTHFLITRFSYPEDYPHLKERFDLFNRFTLPSIRSQVNQNFTWLIQTNNPEWFDSDINATFCDLKEMERVISNVATPYVITSRCDNDDDLHPLFIRDVQKNFEERELVIDFRGYRYNVDTEKAVIFDRYKVTPSPFTSLIQKSGNIGRGIMNFNHGYLHNHFPVKRVNKFRWVQVIHGTNKLMRWKGSDKFTEVGKGVLWI